MAKITGKSLDDVIHGEEFKKVAGLRIMGNYYAPAEAARLINNYLSPDFAISLNCSETTSAQPM